MGVCSEQTGGGGQLFPPSLSLTSGQGLHRHCCPPPTLCFLLPPKVVFLTTSRMLICCGGGGALWVGGVIV